MEQLTAILTLSKKANKLMMGFDVVKEAVLNQTAKLVLLTNDVSPKTRKEVAFLCRNQSVKIVTLPYQMDEIWYLLGKKAGVMAITEAGFATKISCIVRAE